MSGTCEYTGEDINQNEDNYEKQQNAIFTMFSYFGVVLE